MRLNRRASGRKGESIAGPGVSKETRGQSERHGDCGRCANDTTKGLESPSKEPEPLLHD